MARARRPVARARACRTDRAAASLEELDAHRAGFSDAARMVLVQANGRVGQMGALADVLEVEPRYERAVEACLGDLLQHVLVGGTSTPRQASAGPAGGRRTLRLRRGGADGSTSSADAGPKVSTPRHGRDQAPFARGAVRSPASCASPASMSMRVRERHRRGGHRRVVRDRARWRRTCRSRSRRSRAMSCAGAHLVAGGGKVESRGILATKREIKELRERVATEREALERLAGETAQFEQTIAQATAAIAALSAELHRQEKAIVARRSAAAARVGKDEFAAAAARGPRGDRDAPRARGDRRPRRAPGRSARVDRAAGRQSAGPPSAAGRRAARLATAREHADACARRRRSARHARRPGRAQRRRGRRRGAGSTQRGRELERRVETCATDLTLMRDQRERLLAAVAEAQRLMDDDVRVLEGLRDDMVRAPTSGRRSSRRRPTRQEELIRDARRALDAVRALAAELDVTRATAEADLTHLAQQSLDAVATPLDDVRAEVDQMEAAGDVEPDVRAIRAAEAPDAGRGRSRWSSHG